ncbi:unnamed protein product, partial [Ixodes pacificus]
RHVRAVELRGGGAGGGHALDASPSLGGGGVRGRRRGDGGEGVAGAGAPQAAHGPVCAPPERRVQQPQQPPTAQGLHPAAGAALPELLEDALAPPGRGEAAVAQAPVGPADVPGGRPQGPHLPQPPGAPAPTTARAQAGRAGVRPVVSNPGAVAEDLG